MSDVKVHGPKVRVASANLPKRSFPTVIFWSCVLLKDGRSVNSFLTPLFCMIKKLAMRTNGIKIKSSINQSYCIIGTFYLRGTLPKYLKTFLHKNAVLTIGLTDQSGYSTCLLYDQTFHSYSRNNISPNLLVREISFKQSPSVG